MASKLAPFLVRAGGRTLRASAPRRLHQYRSFNVSAKLASDALQVVRLAQPVVRFHSSG